MTTIKQLARRTYYFAIRVRKEVCEDKHVLWKERQFHLLFPENLKQHTKKKQSTALQSQKSERAMLVSNQSIATAWNVRQ